MTPTGELSTKSDLRESESGVPTAAAGLSATGSVREVAVESLSANIRPLGQLDESFIIATDEEGFAAESINTWRTNGSCLINTAISKRRAVAESQRLLIPETFDLTPAQAAVFDLVVADLGDRFELMCCRAARWRSMLLPADLPPSEARNMLGRDSRYGGGREEGWRP